MQMLIKKVEHFVLHKAVLKNTSDAHSNNKQNAIVESIHAGAALLGLHPALPQLVL